MVHTVTCRQGSRLNVGCCGDAAGLIRWYVPLFSGADAIYRGVCTESISF